MHVEFGASLILAEIGKADFDFIAEFGGFFFSFGNASFITFRKLNGFGAISTLRRLDKSTKYADNPAPIKAAVEELFAFFDFFDPPVGGIFAPVVGNWASENLNPEFFRGIGIEFGECTSDAGERINFEVFESFDREGFIFGKCEFTFINHRVFFAVINVVIGHFVDLDGGVLGVDLPLDKALEDFWHPNVEADLAAGRDDFEAEMLLNAARVFEFSFVTQDTV